MQFELISVDAAGTLFSELVEAPSKQAALASTAQGRRSIIEARVVRAGKLGGRAKRQALLAFCEALEQVLEGGLTLTQALRALAVERDTRGATIAASIEVQLARGLSPSRAFEASGLPWPPFLLALLRSGERSGRLADSFHRFVRSERAVLDMQRRVISASLYPIVLLLVSGLVLMFLLGFVVPKFALALDDIGRQLPTSSRLVIDLGRWIAGHALTLLIVLPALMVGVVLLMSSTAVQNLLRTCGLRLPLVGDVLRLSQRAQWMRVASALLAGGATLSSALEVAAQSADPITRAQLGRARKAIDTGQRPSKALRATGLLSEVATQLVGAAERTGGLTECFERLAATDEQRLAVTLERLTTVYGPVLLLLVAVAVGAVVVSLYWPLLQLFDSLK